MEVRHIKDHCRERKKICQKSVKNIVVKRKLKYYEKTDGKINRINLKIDSSYIGMESGRTYQSRSTGKLSFRVEMGSANNESQVSGGLSNSEDTLNQKHALDKKEKRNLSDYTETKNNQITGLKTQNQAADAQEAEEQNQELIQAQGKLSQTAGIRRIPYINRMEEYNALEDIRQQCILYLWNIFFGESRANEMADKMGVRQNTGQQAGYHSYHAYEKSTWIQTDILMQGQMQQLPMMTSKIFTITAERETVYMESENTSFSTKGCVKTADGREISFNLDVSMSRNFVQYTKETVQNVTSFIDPLVINLNGNVAEVSDQKFYFDLDADGEAEEISRLCEDSGYLALDFNQDGIINDGSELFGTKSGDGFEDLSAYDEDGNGWIDESDDIWNKLKIWVQDEHGNSKMYSLAEQGVGAICLQNVSTEFGQRGSSGEVNAAIRNTGIFLYENGNAGTIQHLDLARGSISAAR